MHYKNGKEAKVGHKIVSIDEYGSAQVGTVIKTVAEADTCDLAVVPINTPASWVSAKDSLLIEDAELVAKETEKEEE